MIDLTATKAKIRSSGRTITGWARAHGFDTAMAQTRFRGASKFDNEWLDALKQDGLLVITTTPGEAQ